MKKITVISVIILLSGFNILLLYQNVDLKSQLDSQNQLWENKVSKLNVEIIHSDVDLSDPGVSMVVFFSDQGCWSCVKHEVQNLNKLFASYKKKIRVYLQSNNESYLKRLYGATFPYEVISHEELIFNTEFNLTNPIAVLVDTSGFVQYIYMAEKGQEKKSDLFYRYMSSFWGQ